MKKTITFLMAFIFSFNAFATDGYNPEVEKQKYIVETIKKIDKLIKSEERRPTPLSEISEKLERHFVRLGRKQEQALAKLQRLSKREKVNRMNKNIKKMNKMNPALKLEFFNEENIDEQLYKIEAQVKSYDYEPTLNLMNDALATQVTFKEILIKVKERLLGKEIKNRSISSVNQLDLDVDFLDILEVIVNILIWGAVAVGFVWLIWWAAISFGAIGVAGVLTGGGVLILAGFGIVVVMVIASL